MLKNSMFKWGLCTIFLILSLTASGKSEIDLKLLLEQEKAGGSTNPVLMQQISDAYSLKGGEYNLALSYQYKVKAAELGHPGASFELYEAVSSGLRFNGKAHERNRAEYWLGIAEKFGHPEAKIIKAKLELKNAEPAIAKKALAIIRDMAYQENPKAMLALAEIYIDGVYTEQNLDGALELINSFNKTNQSDGAGFYLSSLAKSKVGDEKGRLQDLNKAAQLGSPKASLELGIILSEGDLQSRNQAEQLLNNALELGLDEAEKYLNEIHYKNNSPILYNINLYRAGREMVRNRLESAGVKLVKSNGYLDYFQGGDLNGAYELIAAYHVNKDKFTLAQLSFRFLNDEKRYKDLVKKLNDRYGSKEHQPRSKSIPRHLLLAQQKSHTWKEGSVSIRLENEVGDLNEMRLEYIIEPFASEMMELLIKAKRSGAESGQLINMDTI